MTCSPSCDCPHRFPRLLILRALTVLGYNNNPPPPPKKKNSTGLNPGPKRKAVFASAIKSICPPINHDKIADCHKVHGSQTISPPKKSTHLVIVILPEYPLPSPPPPYPLPPNSKAGVEFYCKTAGFFISLFWPFDLISK